MATERLETAEGKKKLEERLNFCLTTRREEIKERIRVAKSFGDLSENSEYDEAREAEGKNEAEILKLQEELRHIRVIADHELTYDKVHLGCTVTIKKQTDGAEFTYHVVGATEADPFKSLISDQSPIGMAINGKKVGETAVFRNTTYEILSITKYQPN